MSTYVMSDIHGNYDAYMEMLEKIKFSDKDMLYILGDVVDRGDSGIRILNDMMYRSNVIPILGNHEYMMSICAKFLLKEMTEQSVAALSKDPDILQGLTEWMNVGGSPTISELSKMSVEEREDILDYLGEFTLFETVRVNKRDFIMVHAGLCNFAPDRKLEDYSLSEMLFKAPNYDKVYFKDKYLVTGHLPTRAIWAGDVWTDVEAEFAAKKNKDDIYIRNNHIAIDCGCGFPGGRLACLRLDDMVEFYVDVGN